MINIKLKLCGLFAIGFCFLIVSACSLTAGQKESKTDTETKQTVEDDLNATDSLSGSCLYVALSDGSTDQCVDYITTEPVKLVQADFQRKSCSGKTTLMSRSWSDSLCSKTNNLGGCLIPSPFALPKAEVTIWYYKPRTDESSIPKLIDSCIYIDKGKWIRP